jgi:dolichol-phosphate mannosyltransferase
MSTGTHEPDGSRMLFSIVIPAHDEEQNLEPTVRDLEQALEAEGILYEIVIVNDHSRDGTLDAARKLAASNHAIQVIDLKQLGGFGRAVRAGLAAFAGDAVAVVMADQSDDPQDVVSYYRKLEEGYDCVFGSRFRGNSNVVNYPLGKLIVNRIVNKAIQLLFWTRFNDLTNAFKAFRRHVILECGPYSSSHFNLTIEMSLNAVIRHYNIAEIPISWYGRTWGASNLSIVAMGRRYLSVLLKLFFERLLISDDIMEERLSERTDVHHRIAALETRIEAVEKNVEQSASQLGSRRADPR